MTEEMPLNLQGEKWICLNCGSEIVTSPSSMKCPHCNSSFERRLVDTRNFVVPPSDLEPNINICKGCLYWRGEGIGCGFDPGISTDAPKCDYKGTAIGLLVRGNTQTFMKWQEASKDVIHKELTEGN